ncbi:MAG: alanine racemase [Thermovirgaceae bacterium]
MFRPTRMEVSLTNLKRNVARIREFVSPTAQMMAVVKADGYGMGMEQVAKACIEAGCTRLAVATPDEAIALRDAGIFVPVLVMGPSPKEAAREFVERDITPAVTDLSFAEALSRAATEAGKAGRFHLKVDTGMGRIGFLPSETPVVVEKLLGFTGLEMEGIFTHFATADERNLDYTRAQFRRFGEVLATLRTKGVKFRLRHCCNSAATVNCPDMHLDALRPGLIMYGMWPSGWCERPFDLEPVFRVVTQIAVLRELPPGSGVGYGLKYMTRGNERVAVLPVGYHDGYTRLLSMKADVLIRGKRAPVIGSICMDQTMVDVTNIPEADVGDEVVLVGRQGSETVTPEETAGILQTINYEIPNLFTKRVERVYV